MAWLQSELREDTLPYYHVKCVISCLSAQQDFDNNSVQLLKKNEDLFCMFPLNVAIKQIIYIPVGLMRNF